MPKAVNSRARPIKVVTPLPCKRAISIRTRWAVRSASSARAAVAAAALGGRRRPIAPVAAQDCATRLCCRQCRPRPLADQFPLLRRHRRVDAHHKVVGTWHLRGSDCVTVLEQLRQHVGSGRDSIEPRRHQRRAKLPTSSSAAGKPRTRSSLPVALSENSSRPGRFAPMEVITWRRTHPNSEHPACCRS